MTGVAIAIAIASTFVLATIVLAFKFRAHRGRYGMYSLFRRLRTTPGQEQVIRTALSRLKDTGRSALADAKASRPELSKMLRSDSFDESMAHSWFAAQERKLDAIWPEMIHALREVHGVLDPDQRRTLGDALESGRLGWGHSHRCRHRC